MEKKKISYKAAFQQTYQLILQAGKGLIWLAILLKIACGLLPLLYISVYARFMDAVIEGAGTGGLHLLLTLIPAFVCAGILNYFSQNILKYLRSKIRLNLSVTLRLQNIHKISKLEYCHIEDASSYDLIRRVQNGIPDIIISAFFSYLSFVELLLKILSVAAYMFVISPWFTILLILMSVPIALVSLRTGKENYEAYTAYQAIERRISDYESVLIDKEYAEERTLFGFSDWFSEHWKTGYKNASDILLKVKRKMYVQVKVAGTLVTICFLAMIFVMFLGAMKQTVSVGAFSAVSSQLLSMSSTITWMLPVILQSIVKGAAFLEDVNAFENLSEQRRPNKPVKIDSVDKIEFRNVSFKYPGTENYILRGLNLTLESGKSYALVGENGSGKTTLTKLLLGLYPDYQGQILINSVDLKDVENLNELFSVAFQDFSKYEVSLRNNITLGGHSSISDERIREALSALQFDLDLSRFPKGLDTEIGYLTEQNTNLSIGQWQKLILVRALAHNGIYYILDEPTAALDPVAEAAIYADYLKFISGQSALIITHRLGAARMADKIIVLREGRIAEFGTHDELIEKGEIYYTMYETQKGWYL